LHTNFGNIWSRYAATIGVQQNGLDEILRRVIRTSSHNMQTSLDDLLSGRMEMPSPKFNYRSELNSVYERVRDHEFEINVANVAVERRVTRLIARVRQGGIRLIVLALDGSGIRILAIVKGHHPRGIHPLVQPR
jgi:hypothetical protein